MIQFIEVLDRAYTGPVCEIKEWDMNIISKGVREKLKEYGLEGTCDPQNPINTDDGLADKFWKAGFDLAVDTGMLCMTTKRIIKFTDDELRECLTNNPSEIYRGRDLDRSVISNRKPDDKKVLFKLIGPFGHPVSEDLYIPITQSAIQYRIIDAVMPPSLETVYGRPLKSRTPYETLAGKLEVILQREAARRAQRPGIPIRGGATSPTEYGNFGGYGVPGGADPETDINVVLTPAELKTDFTLLHKVAHFLNCGSYSHSGYPSMIGGFPGPPEGAAITSIAGAVLQVPVHQAKTLEASIFDIRYSGNCGRDAVWSNSIVYQAVSRNTHLLLTGMINPVAGPCTDMLLHEGAVQAINCAVSGCAIALGVRSGGGRIRDYVTGLESKFTAEVCKSACALNRADGNEIVKKLIPKYEGQLKSPPKGKSFSECFDLKTLRPTKEWLGIYEKVWKELEDLGLFRNFHETFKHQPLIDDEFGCKN